MKKLTILIMVLAVGITLLANPDQNAAFYDPEIAAITCDGNLSDWSDASATSLPYIYWADTGLPGTTTTAQFAWNDAADMLYIAVITDVNEVGKQVGGWAVIGSTLDKTSSPWDDVRSTQLGFGLNSTTSIFEIVNEIDYYGSGRAEGSTGVQAGQSTTAGVTTFEIAIPLWADWTVMTDGQALSSGDIVSVYAVMQDELAALGGTNMTFDGNNGNPGFAAGNWGDGAEVTLGYASEIACWQAIDSGFGQDVDLNQDCYINMEDYAILAQDYLDCNNPLDLNCQ